MKFDAIYINFFMIIIYMTIVMMVNEEKLNMRNDQEYKKWKNGWSDDRIEREHLKVLKLLGRPFHTRNHKPKKHKHYKVTHRVPVLIFGDED